MGTKDPFFRKDLDTLPIPAQYVVDGPDSDSEAAQQILADNHHVIQQFVDNQRAQFELNTLGVQRAYVVNPQLAMRYQNINGSEIIRLTPYPQPTTTTTTTLTPPGVPGPAPVVPIPYTPPPVPLSYLMVLYETDQVAAFNMGDLDQGTLNAPVYKGTATGSNWGTQQIFCSMQLQFGGTEVILSPINWKSNEVQTYYNICTTALNDVQVTANSLTGGEFGTGGFPLMNGDAQNVWTLADSWSISNGALKSQAGIGFNTQAFHIGPDGTYYTPNFDQTPYDDEYTASIATGTGGDVLQVEVHYISSGPQTAYNVYKISVADGWGEVATQMNGAGQMVGWSTASGTATTFTPAQFGYTYAGIYYQLGPQTCWQLGTNKTSDSIPYPYGLFKGGKLTTGMSTYSLSYTADWYYQGCSSQPSLTPFLNVILPPTLPPDTPTPPFNFIAESQQWYGAEVNDYSFIESYDSAGWSDGITLLEGYDITASVSSDVIYLEALHYGYEAFGVSATGTQTYKASYTDPAGNPVYAAPWYAQPGTSVSDYSYAGLELVPFPPSTNAGIYVYYTNGSAMTNDSHFQTPQQTYSLGLYDTVYPWCHISNSSHYIQGYIIENVTSSVKTPYLFLDDVHDMLALLTKQLNCLDTDIKAVFMDIPLTTIKGLGAINATGGLTLGIN